MTVRITPLLLFLIALVGPAVAEDAVSIRTLRARYEAAGSLEERRAVLEQLSTRSERDQLQAHLSWLRRCREVPAATGPLARAALDVSPAAAERKLIGLLKEEKLAASRRALLRVLEDAPRERRVVARSFGKVEIVDPAAWMLAEGLAKDPRELKGSASARTYRALHELLALPGLVVDGPTAWDEAGEILHRVPALSEALRVHVVHRLLAALPPPTARALASWPAVYLDTLVKDGVPAALAAHLTKARPEDARRALARIAEARSPDSVPALVEALAAVEESSALFYRILAVLQDLTGAGVPPDPAQWRSWVAGHTGWLQSLPRLPFTFHRDAVVHRGVAFLLERQRPDGSFAYEPLSRLPDEQELRVGATALILYALRKAGVPAHAEPLQRAERFLCGAGGGVNNRVVKTHNYAASLTLMALESLGAKARKREIQQVAVALVEGQMASGGWDYYFPIGTSVSRAGRVDLSNTQYAVLGLRAAGFAGVKVGDEVWQRVLHVIRSAEIETTGEWSYYVPKQQGRKGMSAIAAASLLIARRALDEGLTFDAVLADEQIVRALRNMAEKYGKTYRYRELDLYTLYSIERVGALFGLYSFDGVPWYEEGVKALLERQHEDGGWGLKNEKVEWWASWGRNVDTAYALLFFRRATTPVFSGGLDVPANPDLPIRKVEARHQPDVVPPVEAPTSEGREPAEDPKGVRAIEEVRTGCVRVLRGLLEEVSLPRGRLTVWRALVAVDPLDVEAHVLSGRMLDATGSWALDPVLVGALPTGEPTESLTTRVREALEDASKLALSASTAVGPATEAGGALTTFALALRKASREID